jgi:hypothetical protein
VRVLFLPGVERRFAHAQLPADVANRRARLDLAQGVGDLLLGESRALHRSPPVCGGPPKLRRYSSFQLPSFSGETSMGTNPATMLTTHSPSFIDILNLEGLVLRGS